jgi:hypothetical protein
VLKNRVHAAGNQTFLPKPATFKLRCYQQLPLGTELNCCQSRPPYSIYLSKVPLFGASDDHSGEIRYSRNTMLKVGNPPFLHLKAHFGSNNVKSKYFEAWFERTSVGASLATQKIWRSSRAQRVHVYACVCEVVSAAVCEVVSAAVCEVVSAAVCEVVSAAVCQVLQL